LAEQATKGATGWAAVPKRERVLLGLSGRALRKAHWLLVVPFLTDQKSWKGWVGSPETEVKIEGLGLGDLTERNHLLVGPEEVPRGLAAFSLPSTPVRGRCLAASWWGWPLTSLMATFSLSSCPVLPLPTQPTHLKSPSATKGGHGTGDLGE
jgi:hypothetical protein